MIAQGSDSALIIVALIGAGAVLVNAVMMQRRVKTGNGIPLGQLVSSIADRLFHHEAKLDSIDAEVREVSQKVEEVDTKIVGHIEDSRPLIEVFLKEHPELRQPTAEEEEP